MSSKTVSILVWEKGVAYPHSQWECVGYSEYVRGTPSKAEIRQITLRVRCDQVVQNDKSRRKFIPEEQLASMEKSIAAEGVITPLWVYEMQDGRFRVFDGDIRLLAAMRCDQAGKLPDGTIPVHVYPYEEYLKLSAAWRPHLPTIAVRPSAEEEVQIVDGNLRVRAALDLGMSVTVQLEGVGEGVVSKEEDGIVRAVFEDGRRMRVAGF